MSKVIKKAPVKKPVDVVWDIRTGYQVITKPAGWFDKHPDGEGGTRFHIERYADEKDVPEFWKWEGEEHIPLLKLADHIPDVKKKVASPINNVYEADTISKVEGSLVDFMMKTIQFDTRKNAVLTVGTDKTYATISAAITAASSGDKIEVYETTDNTYSENNTVSKSLQIIGMVAGRGITIEGVAGNTCLSIGSNAATLVRNFTVDGSANTYDAIYMTFQTVDNCHIIGDGDSRSCLYINGAGRVSNCLVTGASGGAGIYCGNQYGRIVNCTATNNDYGFQGSGVNRCVCVGCVSAGNTTADMYYVWADVSDKNWTGDATATGSASTGSLTTAIFTDYGGGDFTIDTGVAPTVYGAPYVPLDANGDERKSGASARFYSGNIDPDPVVNTWPDAGATLDSQTWYEAGVKTVGTFDEAARNTDPGEANVVKDETYKILNVDKTGSFDEAARNTDPGEANVVKDTTYKIANVAKTGSFDEASRNTDPGEANVVKGTSYKILNAAKTGSFDEAARNTDPGIASVETGVDYKILNVDYTGTYALAVPDAPAWNGSPSRNGSQTIVVPVTAAEATHTIQLAYRLVLATTWTLGETRTGSGNITQAGLSNGNEYVVTFWATANSVPSEPVPEKSIWVLASEPSNANVKDLKDLVSTKVEALLSDSGIQAYDGRTPAKVHGKHIILSYMLQPAMGEQKSSGYYVDLTAKLYYGQAMQGKDNDDLDDVCDLLVDGLHAYSYADETVGWSIMYTEFIQRFPVVEQSSRGRVEIMEFRITAKEL